MTRVRLVFALCLIALACASGALALRDARSAEPASARQADRSLLAPNAPMALAASAPGQSIAKLLRSKPLYLSPGGRRAGTLSARQPILGGPTVTPIYRVAGRAAGGRWLQVGVPGRPNGRRRWITDDAVQTLTTAWRVRVSLGARTVTVYRHGRMVRRIRAVVGKPGTPTPRGSFFITERVRQPAGSVIGPWVLALSAYSPTLTDFAGGKGQSAIHGIGALRARPGQAASFGCVRVPDSQSRWLAGKLRPGVPVTITR